MLDWSLLILEKPANSAGTVATSGITAWQAEKNAHDQGTAVMRSFTQVASNRLCVQDGCFCLRQFYSLQIDSQPLAHPGERLIRDAVPLVMVQQAEPKGLSIEIPSRQGGLHQDP